jgi:hypothetical protein
MTLMDDTGLVIQLHPMVTGMIELLVAEQSTIVKCGCGLVMLDFGPMTITVRPFNRPLSVRKRETKEKSRPS